MKKNYFADVTTLSPVTKPFADYVNDGIRILHLVDYDGVLAPYWTNRTFPATYFNPDVRRRVPNPHYDPSVRRREFREPRSYEDAFSSELAGRFNGLLTGADTLTVFVSTWRAHTPINDFKFTPGNEPLYLPWGFSNSDNEHSRKVGAVAEFLAEPWNVDGVRMSWSDDVVLSKNLGVRGGADLVSVTDYMFRHFTNPADDILLVAPNQDYGLAKAEVRLLEKFTHST